MNATRFLSCLALLVFSLSVNAQTVCGNLGNGPGGVRYLIVVVQGKTDTFWANPSTPKMRMPNSGGSRSSTSNQVISSTNTQSTGQTIVIDQVDTIVNRSTVVIDELPPANIEELEEQLKAAKKSEKLKKKIERKKKRAKKRRERQEGREGDEDDTERSGFFRDLLVKFLIAIGIVIAAPIALAGAIIAGVGWLAWKLAKILARPFRKCDCGNTEPRTRKERVEKKQEEELKVLSRHGKRVKSSRMRRYKKVRGKRKRRCEQAEE